MPAGIRAVRLLAVASFVILTLPAPLVLGAPVFISRQPVAVGNGPSAIAVADLNKDGLLDLVTANSAANSISIVLATSPGTFGTTTGGTTAAMPQSLALADMNRDGYADVVAGNYGAGTVTVLRTAHVGQTAHAPRRGP